MIIFFERPLVRALTVSLVIHAVLLIGEVNLLPSETAVPSEALHVVMVRDDRNKATKTPAAPVAAVKPVKPPVHTPAPVTAKAGSWTIQTKDPVPLAAPEAVETKHLPTTETRTESGSLSAQMPGAGVAAVVREGYSADEMRQYRITLASSARRFKRYPPVAKERGWEGTADVALNFNSRMRLPEVLLVRSSGHVMLDDQAVTMLSQAVRVTVLPEALKGRDFRVVLPVQFSLENE